MRTRGKKATASFILALAIGVMLLGSSAWAQVQAPSAVVATVAGQVEVMPKGEAAWVPAQLGMQIFEGANVRAMDGASAELRLPDGSTLTVAENTRFVVTKLDFDNQNQMKSSFFHLATGKLRGVVAKAAIALVQAQQHNFAITTPTAVAAVKGTTLYASFNAATNQTTFFVMDGVAIIRDMAGNTVTLQPGQVTTVSVGAPPTAPAPATPAQQQQMTATTNQANAGAVTVLSAPTVINVPSDTVIVQMVTAPPTATAPAGTPAIIVTPAPPPPNLRPVSPSK
jgi:hypothetical protein